MRRARNIIASATLAVLIAQPVEVFAEEARRMRPILGVEIVPALSLVLPVSGSGAVTSPYGHVHPGGAVGISIHPLERFSLVFDLHTEGWSGQLKLPDSDPIDFRFLSYWVHVRTRTTLARFGPVQLQLDASVALIFSREDAHLFRAEAEGVGIGAGPVLEVALGRYMALSLSVIVESGWAWYDIVSPQAEHASSSYPLVWPRVMIGLGIHGYLIHRPVRMDRDEEEAEPQGAPEEAEPEAEPEAPEAPAETEPEAPPPAEEEIPPPPTPTPVESPF